MRFKHLYVQNVAFYIYADRKALDLKVTKKYVIK